MSIERDRLNEVPTGRAPWRHWGPYLSERAWGTVREDYSAGGDAWSFFPHDHARSRAYRWSEDGLAGICDDRQTLCFALAFWNGRDPILKERIFGLTGPEGNHGEDAKEYWWYLDSTPTHSWMRWRYMYPQAEFPYERLVGRERRARLRRPGVRARRHRRLRRRPLLGDHRRLREGLAGETCSSASPCATPAPTPRRSTSCRRSGSATPGRGATTSRSRRSGSRTARSSPSTAASARATSPPRASPRRSSARTRRTRERILGARPQTPYPKDGIGDHVVHGAATVNPEQTGTKAAFRYRLEVAGRRDGDRRAAPRRAARARQRLRRGDEPRAQPRPTSSTPSSRPPAPPPTRRSCCARRSPGCSGASSSSTTTSCAGSRATRQARRRRTSRWSGRNREWTHLNNMDVISMPDPWEYPWYAAWDLAFHCVALAHVDPEFAKSQLILLCREWYMHPNGQLPAYEWSFSDVNPPVHAWAALRVYEIAGDEDYEFLERDPPQAAPQLHLVGEPQGRRPATTSSRAASSASTTSARSTARSLPVSGRLEQSDGTAWMAMYCQNLLELALLLARHDPTYEDLATKFFEHFALIATALNEKGLWNEEDGFYYDLLHIDGQHRAAARALGRRPAAARGRDDARPGDDGAPARLHGARRVVHGQPPRGALGRPAHGVRRARGLADALDRGRGPAAPDPPPRCSTRRSSSPTTACARSRSSTRRTRCTSRSTASRRRSTTSRARRRPASSAATRTGAARSGSRSTTCSSTTLRVYHRYLGDALHGRVPDGLGLRADAGAGRRRAVGAADRDLPRGRGRPTPGVRRLRALPARPGLARPDPVPRVLPRRHGRRPRRLAPDRLDRPRRRPDHPPRPLEA